MYTIVYMHTRWVEIPIQCVIGHADPHQLQRASTLMLLLLLLLEAVTTTTMLAMLCWGPENLGVCVATVACMPLAGVISPAFGLIVATQVTLLLRDAAAGDQRALRRVSSGHTGRLLHTCALWNATSLVNAGIGLIAFLSPSTSASFHTPRAWFVPTCLLATKLLLAQALKLSAAAEVFSVIGLSRQRKASRAGRKLGYAEAPTGGLDPLDPLLSRITTTGAGSLTRTAQG